MSRKATCAYCKQAIEGDKASYQQKSFHSHCLQIYKTELKDAAKGRDEKRMAKSSGIPVYDPAYSDLTSYLCALLSLEALTPLLAKQISDLRLQHGYSYQEILLTLRYYYEFGEGRDLAPSPTIGIVPYVYKEASSFWQLAQEANDYNQHKTLQSETIIHSYQTTPAPLYCPFHMKDV